MILYKTILPFLACALAGNAIAFAADPIVINLIDVSVRFRPEAIGNVNVRIRGISFQYEIATKMLKRADQGNELHPGTSIDARFLIDRGFVESFWNQGEAAYCIGSLHTDTGPAFAIDGNAVFEEIVVYPYGRHLEKT